MTMSPTPIISKRLIPELKNDCDDLMARLDIRNARWRLFRDDWPDIHAVWENSPWSLITTRKIIDLFIHCHAKRQEVQCRELIGTLDAMLENQSKFGLEGNLRSLFTLVLILMTASIPWRGQLIHPPWPYKSFFLYPSKEASKNKKWAEISGSYGPCSFEKRWTHLNTKESHIRLLPNNNRQEVFDNVTAILPGLLNQEGVPW